MKKQNILFVHEAASQAMTLSNFLHSHHADDFNVRHFLYFEHKYYKKWDRSILSSLWLWVDNVSTKFWKILSWARIIFFLLRNIPVILRADVIHFFAGSSFLPGNRDLFFLKKILRKKVIMEFNGSDVRKPELSGKHNPYFNRGIGGYYFSDSIVDAKVQKIEKYSDFIIVPYHELYANVASSVLDEWKLKVLYHIIDADFYWEDTRDSNNIRIIHAPSNKGIKGSEFISSIIKKLQKKYPQIEYRELTNMPREQILREISQGDIIIDQIVLGDFGVFALESMYNNKITLCYLLDFVLKQYPKDLPIVNVDFDTLESKLEEIVLKLPEYKKSAAKWNSYIKVHHIEKVIWEKYIELLRELA